MGTTPNLGLWEVAIGNQINQDIPGLAGNATTIDTEFLNRASMFYGKEPWAMAPPMTPRRSKTPSMQLRWVELF